MQVRYNHPRKLILKCRMPVLIRDKTDDPFGVDCMQSVSTRSEHMRQLAACPFTLQKLRRLCNQPYTCLMYCIGLVCSWWIWIQLSQKHVWLRVKTKGYDTYSETTENQPVLLFGKSFFLCHKLTLGLRLRSLTNVLANNFDDLNQLNPLQIRSGYRSKCKLSA